MVGKAHQRPFDTVENQSSHEELIRDVIEEVGGGFVPALSPAVFAQGANGGFSVGNSGTGGSISPSGVGSRAFGYADVAGSTIVASQRGTSASGFAQNGGDIVASSGGASAHGWAGLGGAITASNAGARASGYSYGAGSTIVAAGAGAIANGSATSGGDVKASGRGAFVSGNAYKGIVEAGTGGFAGATAFGYAHYQGAAIRANSYGALAFGYASGYGATLSEIAATHWGAFAGGAVYAASTATRKINATAKGSFAFGFADTVNIIASAINSVQFGPGTNSVANSLQIGASGSGVHLHGGGLPASPQNGDIWVEAGVVKVRSNGATVTL